MKRIINYFFIVPVLASLFACGTSRKLEQTTNELNQLKETNSQQARKITAYEADIKQLKEENIQYGKEAEDCRKEKEEMAQRAKRLEKALAEEGTSMEQLRDKTAEALQRFEHQGADVTYKNGLIHINFTDDFFFKPGSSTIAPRGREALNTVAQALRENPHVTCFVVGNTDTITVSGSADNWSLSTERANAVVRVLHYTYNINPIRLTSAGKSKYNPVASNATPEGRERNRRVEIILNPDIDRLWKLSNKE
jgi:chemotaxis protein MotB